MLAVNPSPADTYNRIEFDARVSGSGQRELVGILMEELTRALRSAIYAAENGLNQRKSSAMTRAIAALTALEMGIGAQEGTGAGAALLHFYRFAKKTILDSVIAFDNHAMHSLIADFKDIRDAFSTA